jgi:hypothetical protein
VSQSQSPQVTVTLTLTEDSGEQLLMYLLLRINQSGISIERPTVSQVFKKLASATVLVISSASCLAGDFSVFSLLETLYTDLWHVPVRSKEVVLVLVIA